jgi:hypothetical protein
VLVPSIDFDFVLDLRFVLVSVWYCRFISLFSPHIFCGQDFSFRVSAITSRATCVSDLWPRKHSAPGQIGLPQVGFAADGFIPIERASILFLSAKNSFGLFSVLGLVECVTW